MWYYSRVVSILTYICSPDLLGHTETHPAVVQGDERSLAVEGEPPALVRVRVRVRARARAKVRARVRVRVRFRVRVRVRLRLRVRVRVRVRHLEVGSVGGGEQQRECRPG